MAIRSHSKGVYYYLLRLALLIQFTAEATTPISTSEYVVQQRDNNCCCDELNSNDRMSEIEAKNRRQETEITLLKTMRVEDNTAINQLKDRVEYLEASSVVKTSENEKILARLKRPFRLAPLNIHS